MMEMNEIVSWGSLEKMSHLPSWQAVRLVSFCQSLKVPLGEVGSPDWFCQPVISIHAAVVVLQKLEDLRVVKCYCLAMGKNHKSFLKLVECRWEEGKNWSVALKSQDMERKMFVDALDMVLKMESSTEIISSSPGSIKEDERIMVELGMLVEQEGSKRKMID